MTFKKNWFSYLLWTFYAFVTGVLYTAALFSFMETVPLVKPYGQIAAVCLSFILAAGIFLLIRRIVSRRTPKETETAKISKGRVAEILLVLLLLAAGLLLRAYQFTAGSGESFYFDAAKVTGNTVPTFVNGVRSLYVLFLRGVFLLFGNYFAAGLILQMILQFAAAVLWYFAVRSLSGATAAVSFLTVLMLLPASIRDGLSYSPRVLLLLLCGVLLLMAARYLKGKDNGKETAWYSYLYLVFAGLLVGGLTYLDGVGMLFLIPFLFLFFIPQVEKAFLQVLTVVLTAVLGTAGLLFLDAAVSGVSFAGVFEAWYKETEIFLSYGKTSKRLLALFEGQPFAEQLLVVVVGFLLLLGCFAFFSKRKQECQMLWVALTIGIFIFFLGHLGEAENSFGILFLATTAALMGAGLRALGLKNEETVVTETEEMGIVTPIPMIATPVLLTKPKKTPSIAAAQAEEVQTVEATVAEATVPEKVPTVTEVQTAPQPVEVKKPINYIENPLPLPKKHVKRNLGYLVEVPEEMMKYDIEVSDKDDFDRK